MRYEIDFCRKIHEWWAELRRTLLAVIRRYFWCVSSKHPLEYPLFTKRLFQFSNTVMEYFHIWTNLISSMEKVLNGAFLITLRTLTIGVEVYNCFCRFGIYRGFILAISVGLFTLRKFRWQLLPISFRINIYYHI